ncbi:hypothetical protein AMTR_s00072p00029700 [Amborella trichopoda]|uniref:Uncharacterized protein n=2 Tax=Amborella trichopoda TaxID=13333 RepID=W1NS02_AMBTC|nr:hypothetical protein AMTR_s00072p00029700 [Amborella trichopoda]
MHKESQDCSLNQTPKESGVSHGRLQIQVKSYDDIPLESHGNKFVHSSSFEMPIHMTTETWLEEHTLKSEEPYYVFSSEANSARSQGGGLKKSHSVGSGLDKSKRVPYEVDRGYEHEQGLLGDDPQNMNFTESFVVLDSNLLAAPLNHKDAESNRADVESYIIDVDLKPEDSVTSMASSKSFVGEVHEDFGRQRSIIIDSGEHLPEASSIIRHSQSSPSLSGCEESPVKQSIRTRLSRSCDDLRILASKKNFLSCVNEIPCEQTYFESVQASYYHNMSETVHSVTGEKEGLPAVIDVEDPQGMSGKDCVLFNQSGRYFGLLDQVTAHSTNTQKSVYENLASDEQNSENLSSPVKDLILEQNVEKQGFQEMQHIEKENEELCSSPHERRAELSSHQLNLKRVEEWINQIDLQNCFSLPETGECSTSPSNIRKESSIAVASATKIDSRISSGMEAAKGHIRSLNSSSTTAQMPNLGLSVIPYLGIFGSLRVINLSGNAIVRITTGALPRGLHTLNLSKNFISIIEGLRELTRLRVLDLRYNRISRIGHGLASCSSLKELYLAGNKISEVEGLHRLLKLNVLDLSFNKISTAKSLGQLAANYSSLQAINLEGNPAQKNMGEEQLKKSLLTLLPNLIYLNRQPIKASASVKEISDRGARSIPDRSVRSDHKHLRRGGHSVASHKASGSLSGRGGLNQSMISPKRHKSRHSRFPPSGIKGTHHYQLNLDSQPINPQHTHWMRRSRSEGTLQASA